MGPAALRRAGPPCFLGDSRWWAGARSELVPPYVESGKSRGPRPTDKTCLICLGWPGWETLWRKAGPAQRRAEPATLFHVGQSRQGPRKILLVDRSKSIPPVDPAQLVKQFGLVCHGHGFAWPCLGFGSARPCKAMTVPPLKRSLFFPEGRSITEWAAAVWEFLRPIGEWGR